jgi:uncharacterized protein (DUF1330 family)
MTVKIIGMIRLKDSAAFEVYRSKVGATVELYGGTVAARGAVDKTYWNELACGHFGAFVELNFPSAKQADLWANSPEYQSIVSVRQQAMDLTLFRVQD